MTGANFNKMEVAWRFKTDNLGTRPEFKLEGTPLADLRARCMSPPARAGSVIALDAHRRVDVVVQLP